MEEAKGSLDGCRKLCLPRDLDWVPPRRETTTRLSGEMVKMPSVRFMSKEKPANANLSKAYFNW
jgi:hypothetical protein